MKRLMFLTLCGLFLFCGCAHQVMVNGKYYDMLSEDEYNEMIAFARLTLTLGSHKLTESQKSFVLNTPPKVTMNYTGDKEGSAVYQWNYNDMTIIRLYCKGEFLTEYMVVKSRRHEFERNTKDKLDGRTSFKKIQMD